jgi:hypothetical protein
VDHKFVVLGPLEREPFSYRIEAERINHSFSTCFIAGISKDADMLLIPPSSVHTADAMV